MPDQNLEKEIQDIHARNRRVEADKAWEVSKFRIFTIAMMTYIVAALLLYLIGLKNFPVSALIPTTAYLVSTQSLPLLKSWWIKKFFPQDLT